MELIKTCVKGLDKKPNVWYTKYNKERKKEVHTMETIIVLAITAGVVAFVAIFVHVIDKIIGWYYDRQDAKRRLAHPELYQLFDAVKEKGNECSRWYNNEIAPRKKQIDAILQKLDYYPAKIREQKEQELEELRNTIYLAEITEKVLREEKQELCKKIREYINKKNLTWAKKWGW